MIPLRTRPAACLFRSANFVSWDHLFTMRHLDPSYANLRHSLPQPIRPAATTLVMPFVLEFELTPRLL